MKKSFLLLAGLILLAFTACQNDELVNGGSGNETAVSFFNGKTIDKTEYMGLLGGIRYEETQPSLTINGTRF